MLISNNFYKWCILSVFVLTGNLRSTTDISDPENMECKPIIKLNNSHNADSLKVTDEIVQPEAISILLARLKEAGVFNGTYKEFQSYEKQYNNLQDMLTVLTPFAAAELALITKVLYVLSPLQLGGGVVLSYFLADLTTGISHFTLDTLDWRNPMYSKDIKEKLIITQWHHDAPSARSDYSYWDLTRSSYFVGFGFLTFAGISCFYGYDMGAYLLSLTTLMADQGHYTHTALAHGKFSKKPLVKLLHRSKLILHPRHHNIHHIDPNHASHFCILTGHADIILDPAISVGRSVYNFFRKWCGKMPQKED